MDARDQSQPEQSMLVLNHHCGRISELTAE
jgi:hypothetical protein